MIGIIGAMDSETQGLKNLIIDKKTKLISGIEFVCGTLNGKDVVCAKCNPGKVNSALCAQAMILEFKPDIIINSGVAGSLTKELGIYDVAIASGIQIIIFLSGLQTISTNMYEAAAIEGCTAWESLWKITFPMISSLFLVNWIYTIVDFCMRTDNEVIDKISTQMITHINYGFASALSWIYFLIVIAIIGVSSFIISKGVYYYD